MYRIYIDEVGNPDLKSSQHEDHRYLCLAGIIFDLEYVKTTFSPDLENLKARYFDSHPDDPIIFHRKELVHKKPPFSILKDNKIETQFNNEFLDLLTKWDYKIIAVLIDKLEHNEKYRTWKYDPYHYCQEVLIERYKLFLEINDSKGDVMYESRGKKEDMRLKNSYSDLWKNGTHFLNAEELQKYLTTKKLKIKPKSANIAGLQIADLLAHPCRRYFYKNILKLDDKKNTFSDKVLEILEDSKFFRYKGIISNYGLKKLP